MVPMHDESPLMKKSTTLLTCLFIVSSAACKKEQPAPPHPPASTAQPAVPEPPKGIPAPPDVAAAPPDAEKTATGLASKILQKGTGTQKPNARLIIGGLVNHDLTGEEVAHLLSGRQGLARSRGRADLQHMERGDGVKPLFGELFIDVEMP